MAQQSRPPCRFFRLVSLTVVEEPEEEVVSDWLSPSNCATSCRRVALVVTYLYPTDSVPAADTSVEFVSPVVMAYTNPSSNFIGVQNDTLFIAAEASPIT